MFIGNKPDGKKIMERLIELLSLQQNVKRTYILKEIKNKKEENK